MCSGHLEALRWRARSRTARQRGGPSKLRSRSSALMILLVAGVSLGLSACQDQEAPPPDPVRPIKTLSIGGSDLGVALEFPGTIEAALHSRMGFEVPGRMIEFPVGEGDRLKRGDLIARLDPRDFHEEVNKAQAQAEYLETEYKRRQVLYDEGVDSKLILDKARRNYEMQVANVATAEKALEDAELRAPYDGIVAAKLVKDFRNVQAKEQVVIFEDDSSLKIEVAVPEVDYLRMVPGLSLEERTAGAQPRVVIPSMSGREFPARITEIANIADPATRTFRVTLAFEKPEDVVINSGMTAKVVVRSGGNRQLLAGGFLVPVQAARGDETGNAFVWVIDPKTMEVHRKPVKLGEMTGEMIQVTTGLSDGDEIAISGIGQLREGLRVRRFGG